MIHRAVIQAALPAHPLRRGRGAQLRGVLALLPGGVLGLAIAAVLVIVAGVLAYRGWVDSRESA